MKKVKSALPLLLAASILLFTACDISSNMIDEVQKLYDNIQFTAASVSDTKITLEWDSLPANKNISSVDLTISSSSGTSSYEESADNLSYTFDSLTADTDYSIIIQAVDSDSSVVMQWDGTISTAEENGSLDYTPLNSGSALKTIDDFSANYLLMHDIDLDGISWSPLDSFSGTFDGTGHSISNLTIDNSEDIGAGLFSEITGTVKRLDIIDCNISSEYSYTGALAGYVSASDDSEDTAAVIDCVCSGNISGGYCSGGLAGYISGTISGCSFTGTVSGSGYEAGLLAGNAGGTISRCYSSGTVSGEYNVGGIAGSFDGTTISESYSEGIVSGVENAGGIAGSFGGTINNCYSTSSVSADASAGGLIGWSNYATVNNCYYAGNLTGTTYTGGLVGSINADYGTEVTTCYFDTELSGQSSYTGEGADAAGALTTSEMKDSSNYSGWDFTGDSNGHDDYWDISSGINSGYPYLTSLADSYE